MDPITHFLTGACIGRAGLNRKTAYATMAAVLAAEAADLDIFWGFAGPVEELKHHRGFTHTFIGAPVVAAAVVGAIWLLHRWRSARRDRGGNTLLQKVKVPPAPPAPAPKPGQPIRWRWLYLTALIAALSHILLDWTNNYGVRPFSPFNPRWYAGSFMFIAEPLIWALLLLALFMPWLLGLADREIGARGKPFRGRGWAVFALAGMAILGCLRWWEHAQAIVLAQNAGVVSAPILRTAAEPYPVNPFRWHVLFETADYYQTAEVNSWTGAVASDPPRDVLYKPRVTPAVEAAKRTFLGRVYLDWGKWAVVRDLGQDPVPGMDPPKLPPTRTWTTVEFTDLRFDYGFLAGQSSSALGDSSRAPLSGWVYIVDGREDAGEAMDGREQH
ncbi:MAG: metal-dependent hydrolase [Terracidiphilus sp.]